MPNVLLTSVPPPRTSAAQVASFAWQRYQSGLDEAQRRRDASLRQQQMRLSASAQNANLEEQRRAHEEQQAVADYNAKTRRLAIDYKKQQEKDRRDAAARAGRAASEAAAPVNGSGFDATPSSLYEGAGRNEGGDTTATGLPSMSPITEGPEWGWNPFAGAASPAPTEGPDMPGYGFGPENALESQTPPTWIPSETQLVAPTFRSPIAAPRGASVSLPTAGVRGATAGEPVPSPAPGPPSSPFVEPPYPDFSPGSVWEGLDWINQWGTAATGRGLNRIVEDLPGAARWANQPTRRPSGSLVPGIRGPGYQGGIGVTGNTGTLDGEMPPQATEPPPLFGDRFAGDWRARELEPFRPTNPTAAQWLARAEQSAMLGTPGVPINHDEGPYSGIETPYGAIGGMTPTAGAEAPMATPVSTYRGIFSPENIEPLMAGNPSNIAPAEGPPADPDEIVGRGPISPPAFDAAGLARGADRARLEGIMQGRERLARLDAAPPPPGVTDALAERDANAAGLQQDLAQPPPLAGFPVRAGGISPAPSQYIQGTIPGRGNAAGGANVTPRPLGPGGQVGGNIGQVPEPSLAELPPQSGEARAANARVITGPMASALMASELPPAGRGSMLDESNPLYAQARAANAAQRTAAPAPSQVQRLDRAIDALEAAGHTNTGQYRRLVAQRSQADNAEFAEQGRSTLGPFRQQMNEIIRGVRTGTPTTDAADRMGDILDLAMEAAGRMSPRSDAQARSLEATLRNLENQASRALGTGVAAEHFRETRAAQQETFQQRVATQRRTMQETTLVGQFATRLRSVAGSDPNKAAQEWERILAEVPEGPQRDALYRVADRVAAAWRRWQAAQSTYGQMESRGQTGVPTQRTAAQIAAELAAQ